MCNDCRGGLDRRALFGAAALVLGTGLAMSPPAAVASGPGAALTPDQALERLRAGNQRYVTNPQSCVADMARRPVRPLTERIAPIVKAFMRSNHITQVQLASELERDQSYVSERVTGKRAFTTDELDAIALLAEWEPRRFIQHLASAPRRFTTGAPTPWPSSSTSPSGS